MLTYRRVAGVDDGVVDHDEECDDGNVDAGDGCFEKQVEFGWECDDTCPSVCTPSCGDSLVFGDEDCDTTLDLECLKECIDEDCESWYPACEADCNTFCGTDEDCADYCLNVVCYWECYETACSHAC